MLLLSWFPFSAINCKDTEQRQMTHSEPHFHALSVGWLSAETLTDKDDKSGVSEAKCNLSPRKNIPGRDVIGW